MVSLVLYFLGYLTCLHLLVVSGSHSRMPKGHRMWMDFAAALLWPIIAIWLTVFVLWKSRGMWR